MAENDGQLEGLLFPHFHAMVTVNSRGGWTTEQMDPLNLAASTANTNLASTLQNGSSSLFSFHEI